MSAWQHSAASRARAQGLLGPSFSAGIVARIALLAVAIVFFQTGVISELPVLGVSIDLSPLLVAFVGLLCGSMLGAITGFFTLTGYWSGRLREARDPQAALIPLLVGAAASGASLVGYSLMEFLLGVDAPVSLELLREIVLGVFVNAVVALPTWAVVRRSLEGGLPEDPRRRRRRAYTTGGLSPLSRA